MITNGRTRLGGLMALGAAVLLTTAVGFAQQGEPGGPGGPPPHGRPGPGGPREGLGPLARDLDLSEAQKAQVKEITASFEESTKGLREQLHTLFEKEHQALDEGTFDEAAVRAAAVARANVQVELDVAHARMRSQIFAVLTAEQKAKLAERRQQFAHRRKG